MSEKRNRYNEHHPIPTCRERPWRSENLEDVQDILFKSLKKQPTVRMRVREHDGLHASNTKRLQDRTMIPMTPREMLFRYLHMHKDVLSNKVRISIIQTLQQWKDFYDAKYVK